MRLYIQEHSNRNWYQECEMPFKIKSYGGGSQSMATRYMKPCFVEIWLVSQFQTWFVGSALLFLGKCKHSLCVQNEPCWFLDLAGLSHYPSVLSSAEPVCGLF